MENNDSRNVTIWQKTLLAVVFLILPEIEKTS
jgi:hypothetical protein